MGRGLFVRLILGLQGADSDGVCGAGSHVWHSILVEGMKSELMCRRRDGRQEIERDEPFGIVEGCSLVGQ
jgi:hypothetical protein